MDPLAITIYKTVDEEYYFRLRDERDYMLLTSMQYRSYSDCFNDIYVMQMYGQMDFIFEKCPETKKRKYFLKLNGQRIIAESVEYIFERTMKEDLSKIVKGVKDAIVIDMCSTVRFYRRVRTNE
jgi:hypothetical protein